MKPTTKILSVLIATQIAFSCFALAVETVKGKSASTLKTAASSTKSTRVKTTGKVKSITKKNAGKATKATPTKAAIKSTGNKITMGMPSVTSAKVTTATATAIEPKEAIETEIETIDQMEAAAKPAVTTGAAVTPTTTSVTTVTPAAESKFVTYNISLDAYYNTAAEAPETGDRSQYMSYDLIPLVTIGPVRSLVWFMYNQNLVDDTKSELLDITLASSLAKPYNAGDYITLNPAIVITVPHAKATKDVAQLNSATNLNVTIGLNTKNLGLDGMVLNWQTGYTKMNNDFTTSSAGEPLTSYRLRQRVNLWYPILDKLTFKTRLEVNSNFSYENVVRNTFVHFELLEYRFLDNYWVQLVHGNAGAVLAATTYEDNFKFYDSKSSELALGVGADF